MHNEILEKNTRISRTHVVVMQSSDAVNHRILTKTHEEVLCHKRQSREKTR